MATSYNRLWKKLIDEGMSKTDLRLAAGMSSGTLARLSKCEPVETTTLEKICRVLQCNIGDIIDYIPDTGKSDACSGRKCHQRSHPPRTKSLP